MSLITGIAIVAIIAILAFAAARTLLHGSEGDGTLRLQPALPSGSLTSVAAAEQPPTLTFRSSATGLLALHAVPREPVRVGDLYLGGL